MTNIVFRTDASSTIGTGHVMRCLTLAAVLHRKGATVSFICREHQGHLCGLIEKQGFEVARHSVSATRFQTKSVPAHAPWLGATWQEDAAQTLATIGTRGAKPNWLVVDHYALDERWQRALRPAVERILVIDDLADRLHDCDLLLDQNLVAEMHTRYAWKVPADCSLLLGPDYALLQPIYADLHGRVAPREGPIRRILVFFGGADSDNLTGRAVGAFLRLKRTDIEVDIVINARSPHFASIRQQLAGHNNLHLHSDLPTLALFMAQADLAVGAGGATSWERLCLGLPAVVVTVAENQRPVADELHKRGLIFWLGHKHEVSEQALHEALAELVEQSLNVTWSVRCHEAVDGHGVCRLTNQMTIPRTIA